MRSSWILWLALSCVQEPARGPIGEDPVCGDRLLPLRSADPALAQQGLTLLEEDALAGSLFPEIAIDYLWLVWERGPLTREQVIVEMRTRYGLHQAPWASDDLPAGLRRVGGGMLGFDCLLCHVDTVAGEVVMGAGSSTLNLDRMLSDLVQLGEMAQNLGLPVELDLPLATEGWTGAPGATDAMAMGVVASLAYGPGGVQIQTDYGYQQAPAWWTRAYKERLYTDGSGSVDNHRTMSAMSLAYGRSWEAMQARDDDLVALTEAMLAMEAPVWPFDPPDPADSERGEALYSTLCADCHRPLCDTIQDVRIIEAAEVGTDPVRAAAFGDAEAAWVNASWFGEGAPLESTGGYLAPPLVGVWATPPYLHNGTVPTLWGVLSSTDRPEIWRREGRSRADYDSGRVGWRVQRLQEVPADQALEVVDTRIPGMSNRGHLYGDHLTDAERAELIAFLTTL